MNNGNKRKQPEEENSDERQKAFQEFKRKEEELLKFKEEGRTAENGNLIYSYYQKKYDDLAEKYEFEKQIKPKGQLEKLSSFSSATIPSEHSSAKPRGHVETKKENLGENSSSKPDGHFKTKKDPKVVKGKQFQRLESTGSNNFNPEQQP
ncbi:hypothetical protein ACQ4LE_004789 [Meloidogyne hapla]